LREARLLDQKNTFDYKEGNTEHRYHSADVNDSLFANAFARGPNDYSKENQPDSIEKWILPNSFRFSEPVDGELSFIGVDLV
jgi:hypothetical protein